MAFSDPGTHSPGIINRMAAQTWEIIRRNGYKGLYAQAVTSHPLSQRAWP